MRFADVPDKPKIYIDSCCIISLATYKFTGQHEKGRQSENDYLEKLLRAAEDGHVELVTSTLTLAECQYIVKKDTRIYSEEVQRLFDSILLSGRLFTHVSSDVFMSIKARNLLLQHKLEGVKGADSIHLASAVKMGCKEFITLDGDGKSTGLLKKAEDIKKMGLAVIKPSSTSLLPDEYLQETLPDTENKILNDGDGNVSN